jgi:hypothetical protein
MRKLFLAALLWFLLSCGAGFAQDVSDISKDIQSILAEHWKNCPVSTLEAFGALTTGTYYAVDDADCNKNPASPTAAGTAVKLFDCDSQEIQIIHPQKLFLDQEQSRQAALALLICAAPKPAAAPKAAAADPCKADGASRCTPTFPQLNLAKLYCVAVQRSDFIKTLATAIDNDKYCEGSKQIVQDIYNSNPKALAEVNNAYNQKLELTAFYLLMKASTADKLDTLRACYAHKKDELFKRVSDMIDPKESK